MANTGSSRGGDGKQHRRNGHGGGDDSGGDGFVDSPPVAVAPLPRRRGRRADGAGEAASLGAVFRPILLLAITVFIDLLGFGIVLPN